MSNSLQVSITRGGGGEMRIAFMLLPLATMPKTLEFTAFLFFLQHTAQGCGARHVVTGIHAFGDHVQNTGIYSIFASLYNIPRKDVEQDTLS